MKVMKMIRLIQRRLIIPRGDTGSFSIPVLSKGGTNNIAVFTIFDETTRTKMFQKIISGEGDVLTIAFTHSDTVNLKPGKYVWDIKYYKNPEYIDDELVNGEEINSYYAGFSLPVCEIRETADNYLVSPEAPTATLSPEQLEIVTGAIHSLNEAIRKTQENVEHYPEIRDEVWYTWDAELGDYVNTGVRANGIVGNGIASAVLNDDYTLTLNFTDGTSFTSTSIRGETGNGIDDIVLNNDFTLTISYTDGESYTTPSIRGPIGPTPQFSIGTVQDGAVAAANITGTAENPVLNLTLPNANVPTRVSQLENDANYAADANYVHTDNNYTTAEKEKLSDIAAGAEVNVNADWDATSGDAQILNKPTKVSDFTNDAGYLTTETDPTVPAWAKAAQKPSYTAAEVGATTEQEVSSMIAEAIGQINSFDMAVVQALPTQDISTHTIYLVPKTGETNDVYDEYVYINDAWEMVGNTQIDLSNYVQKTDYATNSNAGIIKIPADAGLTMLAGQYLMIAPASLEKIKTSTNGASPITTGVQHASTFYGLAKAAGDTTQSQSDNSVGQYTDEAKTAIQTMLDVPSNADIPTQVSQLTNDAGYLTDDTDKADVIVDIASGSIASFSDGADDLPVQDLVVQIEPVQAGSGDPSPDNVRAITGWIGVKVTRTGKNLLNPLYRTNLPNNIRYYYGTGNATKLKKGTYTLSISQQVNGIYVNQYASTLLVKYNTTFITFTLDSETDGIAFDFYKSNGIDQNVTCQLELSSTATAYEPYQGETYDIQFPTEAGTVYGGSLDVTTGALTVDRAWYAFNGTESQWIKSSTYRGSFYRSWSTMPSGIGINRGTFICSHAGYISNLSEYAYGKCVSDSALNLWVIQDTDATIDDFKAFLAEQYANGTPVTVCYTLATPQTYQLNITEIRTLLGQNNIWADTGDTTVTYRADTKMFVEQNAPESPVQDVQVNGVSVLSDGVANVPIASNSSFGVTKGNINQGIGVDSISKNLYIAQASESQAKAGISVYKPITSANQHIAAFYGLAKAAGSDEKNSTLPVGQYTDNAKEAIQSMLGITQMLAPTNPNLVASQAYSIGDVFAANGHLYKATAAIAQDEAIIPDTNCVETTMAEAGGKIKDVQVNSASVVGNDGIANISLAGATPGVVRVSGYGLKQSNGYLSLDPAASSQIKTGTVVLYPIVPGRQHESTFYGLSKVAGVDLANETVTLGTYPETSKTAIKEMLGVQDGLKVVRLI